MIIKPKNKLRTESIGFRASARNAYGIEIAARKEGISRSSWIEQAIRRRLIADGLEGEGFEDSLMDRLWSPCPKERLRKLESMLPHLVVETDYEILKAQND